MRLLTFAFAHDLVSEQTPRVSFGGPRAEGTIKQFLWSYPHRLYTNNCIIPMTDTAALVPLEKDARSRGVDTRGGMAWPYQVPRCYKTTSQHCVSTDTRKLTSTQADIARELPEKSPLGRMRALFRAQCVNVIWELGNHRASGVAAFSLYRKCMSALS